jgi:hypothetical protein
MLMNQRCFSIAYNVTRVCESDLLILNLNKMTAEEYFYNHWQKANRKKFGDYGDYNSDEYAIAFAKDYAALRIHAVVGRSERYDLKVGYKDKDGRMKEIVINAENCDEAYSIFKKQFGGIKVEYID